MVLPLPEHNAINGLTQDTGDSNHPQLQVQLLKLQQQLEQVSQQLFASKQRADDGDAVSDALRKDVIRLQQQLRHRDIDVATASERDAAAAAAILAADNVATQLRCDALVAQAREDVLNERLHAASQRIKACEHDAKLLSDENKLLQQEIEDMKAATEEQNRAGKLSLRKHHEQISKLSDELQAERLRAGKLDATVSCMAASSTADGEALREQLSAANISLISNQSTIAQLQVAALAHDRQLQAATDLQAEMQQQVVCLKIF